MTEYRYSLGRAGERFAAWFLKEKGLVPVASNLRVGRGELDLLMADAGQRVAVEVRTVSGRSDPVDAIPISKRKTVAFLGREIGATRIDVVGVSFGPKAATVHWVPDVN